MRGDQNGRPSFFVSAQVRCLSLRFLICNNSGGCRPLKLLQVLKGYEFISFLFSGYKIISYICNVIKNKTDMPTVLELFGLKFLIFTADINRPTFMLRVQTAQQSL